MKHIRDLMQLGLTGREARVYVGLLEVGHGHIQAVARRIDLPHSTVRDTLKSLSVKGLVRTYLKKRRKHYVATDPRVFRERVLLEQSTVERVLPDLEALHSFQSKIPAVEFREGPSGLETLLNRILSEAREVISFHPDNVNFAAGGYLKDFNQKRQQKKVAMRSIFPDTPYGRGWLLDGKEQLREVKLVNPRYLFKSLILVWSYKVATISWQGDFRIIIVEDSNYADTLRSCFEFMWQAL